VSPPVHLTVAGRKTLSAGGALPVAVAVPVLLGPALAVTRIRLRRAGWRTASWVWADRPGAGRVAADGWTRHRGVRQRPRRLRARAG